MSFLLRCFSWYIYSHFTGSESDYSAEIIAQDVTVNCYPGSHKDGSSKVKLTNLVDYQWESKYYKGQLIAIHIAGKTIAYGIKGNNSSGRYNLQFCFAMDYREDNSSERTQDTI